MEDRRFLAQKLDIHLGLWAAEKSELEHLMYMAERSHDHNQAIQQHRKALLDVALGLREQELQLVNFKLEAAVDDIGIYEAEAAVVNSQLQREKEHIEKLKKQARDRESQFRSKEGVLVDKLRAASRNPEKETLLQQLQRQVDRLKREHEAERANERSTTEDCKANAAKAVDALARERDFVSYQVRCMKEEFKSRIKAKDEKYHDLIRQTKKLSETIDEAEKVASERLTEMRGLELRQALKQLDEVRQENGNLRVLYAELEAKVTKRQEISKRGRVNKKDTITRNLTDELNAAAEAGDEDFGLFRRKKTGDKTRGAKRKRKRSETCENDEQSEEDVPAFSTSRKGKSERSAQVRAEALSSGRKALTARSSNLSEGDGVVKTSFFSSSFHIPKVKK